MAQSNLTLADIRAELEFRAPDMEGREARTDQRVNWAIRDVIMQLRMPEFEDTATTTLLNGVREYDVPADYLTTITMKNITQERTLVGRDINFFDRLDQDEEGEPKVYARFGLKYFLHPTPSSDYAGDTLRIRYLSSPAALTDDSDPFPLPDYAEEAVVAGAAYRIHRDLNEVERAKAGWVQYQGILRTVWKTRSSEFLHNPDMGATGIVSSKPSLR